MAMAPVINADDALVADARKIVHGARLRAAVGMGSGARLRDYLAGKRWTEESPKDECAGHAARIRKEKHTIEYCGENEAVAWILVTAAAIRHDRAEASG